MYSTDVPTNRSKANVNNFTTTPDRGFTNVIFVVVGVVDIHVVDFTGNCNNFAKHTQTYPVDGCVSSDVCNVVNYNVLYVGN